MPFELGLAVATSRRREHEWFVLEGDGIDSSGR
jgi:hypothetical protein